MNSLVAPEKMIRNIYTLVKDCDASVMEIPKKSKKVEKNAVKLSRNQLKSRKIKEIFQEI